MKHLKTAILHVMNLDTLAERMGVEDDFLLEMVQLFLTEAQRIVESLAQASEGDEISALAHELKGMAANMDAEPIRVTCFELEHTAKQGDRAACDALIQRLSAQLIDLKTVLQPHLERLNVAI